MWLQSVHREAREMDRLEASLVYQALSHTINTHDDPTNGVASSHYTVEKTGPEKLGDSLKFTLERSCASLISHVLPNCLCF